MACLENARWERYAQFRADGLNKQQAYDEAGYSEGSRNYNKLEINHPEIVKRINELQNKRAKKLRDNDAIQILTKKEAAGLLSEMAVDTGGNPHARRLALTVLARFYGWNTAEEHIITNTEEMSDKQLLDIINGAKGEQEEQDIGEDIGQHLSAKKIGPVIDEVNEDDELFDEDDGFEDVDPFEEL